MTLETRISTFVQLGNSIVSYLENDKTNEFYQRIAHSVSLSEQNNPWFTKENVLFSLNGISQFLSIEKITKWLQHYPEISLDDSNKRVAVIMAGNIPLVGFHDMFCVLISGNIFIGKVSSKDNILLKALCQIIVSIEPSFSEKIIFTESFLKDFDAVIATGSNNTSRYFESYFSKYPHIIRRNRNSVAVLSGNETEEELSNLGLDIFTYFGLGCRNVSKIFIPSEYKIEKLIQHFESFNYVANHNKYLNNYEYNKAIYLVNTIKHYDNGFMLFTENTAIASPISVIYFEFYSDICKVKEIINQEKNNIQCVVSSVGIDGEVAFGQAQFPELWDYSDRIDTLKFLINLT
ncbi:MAG TPA: acyl-CoA reductase [Bacteroidales bacterium]|nr:MAG: hypothetical protein A2W98_03565 [Bacteroidetes bacterium GWF2_33_38]OFY68191.1 MAG: hypothetical protein A2265_01315 [Bacteroidetes bacterium RIFOXYA12_FULL_33_9]HBF87496.1 acyl-CoA reductase [Bacteroidales bacterium]